MGKPGGIVLRGLIEDLEKELDNYYGTLNEIRMGLNTPVPEKPAALIFYEQTKALGIPLVEGSIRDQPHIWLQQYATVMQREALWKMLTEGKQHANKSTGTNLPTHTE